MRWTMAENSLFAILLRQPWWISAAIAAGFLALTLTTFPQDWRWYGAFLGAPFTVVAGIALWRQLRAPSSRRVTSTLEAVRAMSWNDFAAALETGFKRDGYDVHRLAGPAADFEIAKEGRRAVVSGKRWKVVRTGVEPLRELEGAKNARDAHESIFIVAGELTDNARDFATRKRIRLIGGPELTKLVPEAGRSGRAARQGPRPS